MALEVSAAGIGIRPVNNPNYANKAPANVLEETNEKIKELEIEENSVKELLKALV